MTLTSLSGFEAFSAPASSLPILMAMVSFGDTPAETRALQTALEARGAAFQDLSADAEAVTEASLDIDVLLVTARVLDARVSALIEQVSAQASPFLIVLSESGDFVDRIRALELGADDFLRRDSDPREILARAKSLMRRGAQRHSLPAGGLSDEDGAWVLNDVSRVLRSPTGTVCELSKGDVKLIGALVEDHGDVYAVNKDPSQVNSLRVSISRLRRRFKKVSAEDLPIRNIWGLGYAFDAPLRRVSVRG